MDRPLTRSGARRIKRIAKALVSEGLEPDLIVTSPYARASQTADIVARQLDRRELCRVDERLSPGCSPAELAAILEDHRDAETVVMIGHEPDFSDCTAAMSGARVALQKGALVELEFDRQHPDEALLVRLEQPGHLLRRGPSK